MSIYRHWSRWPESSALASQKSSELDAFLRLHALAERMFYQSHLGHEIGHLDQGSMRVAAGDDDMLVGRLLVAQKIQHILDRQIFVAQYDVELIQHHHAVTIVADEFFRALPARGGGGDVAGAILRLPGKALAHDVQRRQLRKFRQHPRLAGVPRRRLRKLYDSDGIAMTDMAKHHADRGGGLALAGAGMDDQQALLASFSGHDLVARGLVLACFFLVASVFRVIVLG